MFYLMNYHDNYSVITKEMYYEIVIIMFKSKIQGLSSSHDASANYQREKKALRMKITDLENELIKAETNMGYFSVSKGAEKLFAQVNEKNDKIKKDISLFKRKFKVFI